MKTVFFSLLLSVVLLAGCKDPTGVDSNPNDGDVYDGMNLLDSTGNNETKHNPNNAGSSIDAHREAAKDSTLAPNDKTATSKEPK